jgi:hypothetical protein
VSNAESSPTEGEVPTEASPTVTRVPWRTVTGGQLEELLHGLLEAMGATSLIWRAGSANAVTASDGGRDLEAVFDRPSPDGELDRQRWWVECKGRNETVERGAVQQAILDASARTDIDVLVVATNSRFSNPTRDWVDERERSFPRPSIKLWDKDRLDRLVRRYPTVAARILPQALTDDERLRLLVTRFEEFGEEPTELDLDYFWERKDWVAERESSLLAQAAAVFLYTEGILLPRVRQWWRLLRDGDVPDALAYALIGLIALVWKDQLPRPVERYRLVASAARMVTACLALMPNAAAVIAANPWGIVVGGEDIADNEEELERWQALVLRPVLAFIQADLLDACAGDCSRVTADNPHEAESLTSASFWELLLEDIPGDKKTGTLVIETTAEPCTVGLAMDSGCPLIVSNARDCDQLLREFAEILQFRGSHPDNVSSARLPDTGGLGLVRVTLLRNQGLSWITESVGGAEEGV